MAILAASGLLLAGRLIWLGIIDRDRLARQANRQRTYVEQIAARPGDIVDRNGRLLATTIAVRSLYAVPSRIADPKQVADELAAILALDADRLAERLRSNRAKHFLWIKRRLSDREVEQIRGLQLPQLPSGTWGFRREFLRRYPQGTLAAHVLGLRGIDGEGRGGIEQKFDAVLRGRDGERVLIRDARGRVIDVETDKDRPPQPGRTIALTLDAVVQLYAERELDEVMQQWRPEFACAIVVDPKSCEILAMASRPAFDPNDPVDVPAAAWKNTAIAAMYEPGSTFKPFIVAWAVDRQIVAREEVFDCEHGVYRMGRRALHDHHPYGRLSVTDILVKSSNIGMAKIGERLTNSELYAAIVAFGFGSRTRFGLPGELPGLVRPLSLWNGYSTGSIPMGQELAVTPLQLITAHAALARGGELATPRLVLGEIDPGKATASPRQGRRAKSREQETGTRYFPALRSWHSALSSSDSQIVSQIVSAGTARWLITGPLRDVVRRGTGVRAQLDDYAVFGKSGTAQKSDPETGGYRADRYVCSFVCGAPADDPRVLVLVLVDDPRAGASHSGGTIAAPSAARILLKTLRYLDVPPTGIMQRAPAAERR